MASLRQLTLAPDLLVIREQTVAHGPWGIRHIFNAGAYITWLSQRLTLSSKN